MSEWDLDRGLAAAFGARDEQSVLRVIERITGDTPRILLRETASDQGASPLIDPSSSERRSIPQGRGSYQILGEIARGGMGVVMKGHDNDLGRDVALKVLHKELAGRPEVLQRFVEEAQIGGQLQHPGIVPVYELGLMADERPYFTMKLVKGRTLAALLAERKSASVDRRRLLDVFESVCQTMAYAHSRGVIHRDLKPANVMVGAFGEVQVVDWGLAKVLQHGGTADEKRQKQTNISIIETVRSEPGSHGSHSLSGSVMGTPAYMSPEQARGEIDKLDERSDVFSLGAVLCEILTGLPPYIGEAEKTLTLAANAKLDDATKRLDACEGDADVVALCRECLAPAQSARPRSAEVIAQRIHEHLVSVEERARVAQIDAAEARVKAREERRARKLTVGLAASVLVTVVLAGGGWVWMSKEASRREHDTETQVTAALNEATLKRGEGQWAEALAAVERARGLAESGSASPALRARVASDVAATEKDAQRARAAVDLARDNAVLLAELADIRQPEGNVLYPTDWVRLDTAHRTIFAQHGFDLDAENGSATVAALIARGVPVELAAALDEWASVRSHTDDKVGAARLLDLSRHIDADATRGKLRDALFASDATALKAFATHEDLAHLPPTTLNLLGAALWSGGAQEEALSVYRQGQLVHPEDFTLAMNLGRRLFFASPPMVQEAARNLTAALALRPASTEAIHELGRALDATGTDREPALQVFSSAVLLHPNDGHLRAHLSEALRELGNLDAAVSAAREATALAPKQAWAHATLGYALLEKGDLNGAIEAFHAAIELEPQEARMHVSLGTALKNQGDVEGAIAQFRLAIELDPKLSMAQNDLGVALPKHDVDGRIAALRKAIELDPKNALAWSNLGSALTDKGDFEGSRSAYLEAIELDPKDSIARSNLASSLSDRHEIDAALTYALEAVELDPKSAFGWCVLGNARRLKNDFDGAIAASRKAIELDPNYVIAYANLGLSLHSKGDYEGAIATYRRIIELDPKYAAAQFDLGNALLAMGDIDGAITAHSKAVEIEPNYAAAHAALGVLLCRQGDVDDAIAADRKAVELDPKNATYLSSLGNALVIADELDDALEVLHAAIEIDPKNASAHYNLGNAHSKLGEPDDAMDSYREAIALEPKGMTAQHSLYNLGLTLRGMGQVDDAIECFRKAAAIDPGEMDVQSILALALLDRSDFAGAIESYHSALAIAPRSARWLNELAWILATAADVQVRNPAEAVQLAERAVEIEPKIGSLWNTLGVARYRAGDHEKCIEALERSMALSSGGDANDWLFLAMAQQKLGHASEARMSYERSVKWMDEHAPSGDDLQHFRSEAEGVLEVEAKKADKR